MFSSQRHLLSIIAMGALTLASPARASAPAGHFIYSSVSPVVKDAKTGLTWQRAASTAKYSWSDAGVYCATLVGSGLGGIGWRVPTVKELLSLVDYSQANGPMVDNAAFPDAPADQYWSGYVVFKSYAGYVDFSTGRIGEDSQTATHLVRCVRSGP